MKFMQTAAAGASLLTIAATGAIAEVANAQDGAENDNDGIIIVTAQRREENIQDVPLAVTAVTAEKLQRSGVTSPDRIEFVAPNVSFSQSGADARISIRGVSSTGIEVNADPVVGFFVDGVYQSRTAQALAGFVDIARVEVVRGPQGTLYGRNTTGGSINIISREPDDTLTGGVEGLVGDYNHFGVRGFFNVPLAESGGGFRFAGLYETRDGWAENLFVDGDTNNDEEQFYGRATATVPLGDSADITLKASHWNQGGQGSGFNAYKIIGSQLAFDGASNDLNPFPLFFSNQGVDPNGNPSDPWEYSNDTLAVRDIEQTQISGTVNVDLSDNVRLTSITAYNAFDRFTLQDSDFSELAIFDVTVEQDVETFTQELQLGSTGNGPLTWVIGAFYLDDQVDEQFDVPILADSSLGFLGPFLINRAGSVETESIAVFGQATVELSQGLNATVGGRWTEDDKSIVVDNLGLMVAESEKFSRFTWRAALDYDLGPNSLAYGYVATGFKSGGFNLNGTPSYDPEKVTAYELGLKHGTPNSGLLNLALFYSDFNDLQVNSFDQATTSSFVRNAATATVKGVELEGEWSPNDSGLSVGGSLSFQDAEYGEFFVTDQFGGTGLVNLDGRQLPRAPRWSGKFAASYGFPVGGGELRPLVQFSFFSSQFQTEFNQLLDRQDSYTKTDLRLFWESDSSPVTVEAFVTNIENEAVLVAGVYGPGNGLFANYGAPRTFGLRLGFNYR